MTWAVAELREPPALRHVQRINAGDSVSLYRARFVMPPPLRLEVRMRLSGVGPTAAIELLRRDWSDAPNQA